MIFSVGRQAGNTVLTDIQQRKTWETQFDNHFIKPTFNDNRVGTLSDFEVVQ